MISLTNMKVNETRPKQLNKQTYVSALLMQTQNFPDMLT